MLFIQIKMMIVSILLNKIVVSLLFVFTNFCYLFAIQIHQHLETVYKLAILFGIIIIIIIINTWRNIVYVFAIIFHISIEIPNIITTIFIIQWFCISVLRQMVYILSIISYFRWDSYLHHHHHQLLRIVCNFAILFDISVVIHIIITIIMNIGRCLQIYWNVLLWSISFSIFGRFIFSSPSSKF